MGRYDRGSGFTAHRNQLFGKFMVDVVGFPTIEAALAARAPYFEKYHSSIKSLAKMEEDGLVPPGAPSNVVAQLGPYWAEHLDFDKYLSPNPQFVEALETLPQTKIVFSNGPRAYCLRCLEVLGVRQFFTDALIFCVDDLMPMCKPETAAFAAVLERAGANAHSSVMFEDSLKNLRSAHALGLTTIGVTGCAVQKTGAADVPLCGDDAVDFTIAEILEMRAELPTLWDGRI